MKTIGHLLIVDLTNGKIGIEPFPVEWVHHYIGGRRINSYLLYKDLKKKISPLSEDNEIIFSCGLLTGTHMPASARLHVSGKSPLTDGLGSSNIGGEFGAKLRAAGFQTLIIKGKSEKPAYLFIEKVKAALRYAGSMWGQDTRQSLQYLKEELGPKGAETLLHIGERIFNIENLFNLRQGNWQQKESLPERFQNIPLNEGSAKGKTVDIGIMVQDFYTSMGWDTQGRPKIEKLRDLGLLEISD